MKIVLLFHVDPGHGWLEVPYGMIAELGIRNEISEYSYYDQTKQLFYLEEDCDAAILCSALEAKGFEVVFKWKEYNSTAPLTRLPNVNTDRIGKGE